MIEKEIDLETRDGAMNTFITHPEEGGPHPLVIFYMDAPGKREELHDMARRIATVGYYVMLPNLYYRHVREFHLGMPGATRERMGELMGALSNAMVCEDTQVMLDYAAGETRLAMVRVRSQWSATASGPFVCPPRPSSPIGIRPRVAARVRLTGRGDSPHSLPTDPGRDLFGSASPTLGPAGNGRSSRRTCESGITTDRGYSGNRPTASFSPQREGWPYDRGGGRERHWGAPSSDAPPTNLAGAAHVPSGFHSRPHGTPFQGRMRTWTSAYQSARSGRGGARPVNIHRRFKRRLWQNPRFASPWAESWKSGQAPRRWARQSPTCA